MPSIALPVSLRGQLLSGSKFSPYSLFTSGSQGIWLDPSDVANLAWRRNLLTYSEQFDASVWSVFRATVAGTRITAPDGTLTATPFTPTANTAIIQPTSGVAGVVGTQYTYTVYAKKAAQDWVYIDLYDGTFPFAFFNLNTGLPGSKSAGVTTSMTPAGNGFFRCTITATAAGATIYPRTFATASDTGAKEPSATAAGVVTHYLWGAQLELGTSATDYQRITNVNTEVLERFPTATMFSDRAGTTAVTTPGTVVGLRLDKSKGLVLGAELVDAFTLGTGWSYSGGVLTSTGTATLQAADETTVAVAGRSYLVTFRVTASSGLIQVRVGNTFLATLNLSGTYTYRVAASGPASVLSITSTTPAFVGSIDNISVRELAGNHATAPTDAARPIYGVEPKGGRRNIFTFSEQFDNAAWAKVGGTIVANPSAAPDSTATADKFFPTTTTGYTYFGATPAVAAASVCSFSLYIKAAEKGFGYIQINGATGGTVQASFVSINLSSGVVGTVTALAGGGLVSPTATRQDVGNGWWRLTLSGGIGASNTVAECYFGACDAQNNRAVTVSGTDGILVWGAQLELGSTATAYQRVLSAYDITESGVPTCHYVQYDGSDDSMSTSAIDFTATDKMSVFAGVRKLSDAAVGVIAELSADINSNNGAFALVAPQASATANYGMRSKGTVATQAIFSGYVAPISSIVTGIANIGGPNTALRINGSQVAADTTSQGPGNFGNYPLFFGRRNNATLPFNGKDYGIIVVGKTASAGEITDTETWLAAKTSGVSI